MSDELIREILREANKGDLFRKILLDAREAGTLVQVRSNPQNLDQSIVGFVRGVGFDTCTIQEVSSEGEEDGSTAVSLRSILQISQNTRKLRRTRLLHEQSLAEPATDIANYDEETEDCISEELLRAREAELLVSLRVATEHDYTQVGGFVREVQDGYVQIQMITTAGEPDGVATVRLADIVCVMRDDRHHRAALQFYRNRHLLYGDAAPGRDSAE